MVVVLGTAGFAWGRPALFSWTGVAPYLTAPAIDSTLRTIAGAAAGSEVVLSYRAEDSVLDDVGKEFIRIYAPLAPSLGEPVQPGWPVIEIERLIGRPDRWPAALQRGDPGHRPGRLSESTRTPTTNSQRHG
jgi:hypothetical protein